MAEKKPSRVVTWPIERRPIPPESLPGAQYADALMEVAKEAHKQDLRRIKKRLRRQLDREKKLLASHVLQAIQTVGSIGEMAVKPLSKKNKKNS